MRSQNGNDYEEAFTQGQLSHFAIWQKLTQHCKSTTFHLIKKEREREKYLWCHQRGFRAQGTVLKSKQKHFKAFRTITSCTAPSTADDRRGLRQRGLRPPTPSPSVQGGASRPCAYSLWVSQSTQWEFPRMFRIDCKAMASLWLVSRDWAQRETDKWKI